MVYPQGRSLQSRRSYVEPTSQNLRSQSCVSDWTLWYRDGILGTKDAHGLYEQFGFIRNAERFMIRKPR